MRIPAPQFLLLIATWLCAATVGEAHVLIYYTAGCSVVEQTSDAQIDIHGAASAVATELGLESVHRGYRSARTERIIFVENGHEPGDYFITSYTKTKSDIAEGKRDTVDFAARLIEKFPKGVLIQLPKTCAPRPDF